MERVTFLLEESGERLSCLLNPESLVMRRTAGVRGRRAVEGGSLGTLAGAVTGAGLTDAPLVATGGGRTELDLDLLFDLGIAGSSVRTGDVRDLTRPFWELAENQGEGSRYGTPPAVRFLWGKRTNVLGLVEAVAERLERFTPEGTPRRSWLSLRMLRLPEAPSARTRGRLTPAAAPPPPPAPPAARRGELSAHRVIGDGDEGGERIDQLAERYLGHPAHWRLLAGWNDLEDPLRIPAGRVLTVPSEEAR